MNNKKKQNIAIAMTTVLTVSAILPPVAVHAQEDTSAIVKASMEKKEESNTLSHNAKVNSSSILSMSSRSEGDPFTDWQDAVQAIEDILNTYEFSNETTKQEIYDFLMQEFVFTGKLQGVSIDTFNKTDATINSLGKIEIVYVIYFSNGVVHQESLTFSISRLPKEGEVAINRENFPDDIFRNYIKESFDTNVKDGVLSEDEINAITTIEVFDYKNIKSLKGIKHFTNLQILNCSTTKINELDIRENTNLEYLFCQSTGISELDLSKNLNLIGLYCFDSKISKLDISNNLNLQVLSCSGIGISELDVSNNPNLSFISCLGTGISKLDVSNNPDLEELYCYDTEISGLDVSHNPKLKNLSCYDTPLAWLFIGANNQLTDENFKISDSELTMHIDADTFDITQAYPGIDSSKITILSGAKLNGNIVSGYQAGTPIVYEYNCGIVSSEMAPKKLKVTIELLKNDSMIELVGNLDMVYTGQPVTPTVNKDGSKGEVTFTYEELKDNNWIPYNATPTNAGKYRVQAHLAGDDFYNEADSKKVEFTISQAVNSWTDSLSIKGWTYDEKANSPTATAKFGDVKFSYSDSRDGIYSDKVPTDAGTWYVKATVTGTNNYTGLENVITLVIAPKNIEESDIIISDIKNDKDVDNLVIKDGDKELEKGIDFDVDKKQDGDNITVIITFKGNYNGTISKSYMVETIVPEEKPKDTGSVVTSDINHIGLLATISMVSAGCIAFLTGKKRKKNIKEN